MIEGRREAMVIEEVKLVLGRTLRLGSKINDFDASTGLFGSIPEFDSMAVVNVILALEEQFGIGVEDDEITAEIFETVGSLAKFVEEKMAG
jgi:acyl carrier protein